MPEEKSTVGTEAPVRLNPLPFEFPGVHYMDEQEIDAVVRVLRSKSLFRFYGVDLQKEAEKFEQEFARYMGVGYALAVSSGTNALSLGLSALGVGPGQEVIVPAYLWVSVVAAVVNKGAFPFWLTSMKHSVWTFGMLNGKSRPGLPESSWST